MVTQNTLSDFPFTQFLKEFPRGVFEDQLSRSGLKRPQRNLLRPRFSEFGDQFRGVLAGQARQGQLPTQTFSDFLGGLDFNQQFYNRFNTPQSRNAFATRNPFTRFRGF